MTHQVKATVVIITRNRKMDLRRAVVSALTQTARPEILVIDDGSTDGTSEMIVYDFPTVCLLSDARSKGYIVQRNRAARVASGEVIVSIDDDACFSSQDVIEHTLGEFSDKRIGAVAIPFVNLNHGGIINQIAPSCKGIYIAPAFCGTAYAIRRDLFMRLDGFKEAFFHQGEEDEFCIRMLDLGFFVRLGTAGPVYHYESPIRDHRRFHIFGPRNVILNTWVNVPTLYLLPHMLINTLNICMHGLRVRQFPLKLQGILKGYGAIPRLSRLRAPVSTKTYRLFRKLKRIGFLPIEDARAT